MRRFLSDSQRKGIENKLTNIVDHHKPDRGKTLLYSSTLKLANQQNGGEAAITPADAVVLYNAKCEDLEIAPSETAKQRFVEQFMGGIRRKSVSFTGLGLTPSCMKPLLSMLYAIPKFVYIDLSLNRLKDAGALEVAEYLDKNPPTVLLDLRSNGISPDGAIKLFYALSRNTHVSILDMSAIDGIERNRVGTQGCKVLATLLIKNQVLESLNLSMCCISADGCRSIGPAMTMNSSLVSLDLSSNKFGNLGAQALFSHDGAIGTIENLNLANNSIGDPSAPFLARQLRLNKTLRSLDLSGNSFGKKFLFELVQAFQHGTQLESLSLARNKLGPGCSEPLQCLIRDNKSIKHWNLSQNPLKDDTVIHISRAVSENDALVSLDLSDIAMTDVGAEALVPIIADHPTLTKLVLNDNKISDKSGTKIAEALAKNKVLTHLAMRGNEMKDESARAFVEALEANHNITDLDLSLNDFAFRAYATIEKAIRLHSESIEKNVANIAARHIDKLKEREQALFQYRAAVKAEFLAVEQAKDERDSKKEMLEMLKIQRNAEIEENEKLLDQLKEEYDKISMERRRALTDLSEYKAHAEFKEHEATKEYQGWVAKRQQVESRVKRAEQKQLDARVANERKFEEMRVHLRTLKDQLKEAIESAHAAKESLEAKQQQKIQEEEEQKRREEEERRAAEEEARKKMEIPKAKVMTIEELRKAKSRQLKSAKRIRRTKSKKKTEAVQPQKSALDELLAMPAPVTVSMS